MTHSGRSSHAADAFGLMALSYEDPQRVANFRKPIVLPKQVGKIVGVRRLMTEEFLSDVMGWR